MGRYIFYGGERLEYAPKSGKFEVNYHEGQEDLSGSQKIFSDKEVAIKFYQSIKSGDKSIWDITDGADLMECQEWVDF
jgi:hypothetical protein